MLNKKGRDLVRKMIRDTFGHCDLNKVKREMKSKSIDEYGCFYHKESIGKGASLVYTSNPNSFASLLLNVNGVGMVSSDALRYKDITPSGHSRGCSKFYSL